MIFNLKKQIGFILLALSLMCIVWQAQAQMHYSRGSSKYMLLNLNTKWHPYLNVNSVARRMGGNIGYGQNLGSHGYYGLFEIGIDSIAFSSLGLLLRYGFEFMRHSPFSIGLGISLTPHYVLRQNRFTNLVLTDNNQNRIFLPYALEISGKFKITHKLSGVLRLGLGSVLYPLNKQGTRTMLPIPQQLGVELGIRYYL